jgi:hypothetical protein
MRGRAQARPVLFSPASLTCALLAAALLAPGAAVAAATRAEYVVQAEPICAAANKDIGSLNRRFGRLHRQGSYVAAGHVLRKTGTRLSAAIDQVRSIPPPPGDEQTISSWLGLVQKIADDNVRLGRAEAAERFGLKAKIERRNRRIATQAHVLVQDWGFYACTGNV